MQNFRIALALMCTLAIVSCGKQDKRDWGSYFPLTVGNEWTYQDNVQSAASRVQARTVKVTGSTDVNNVQCHIMEIITDGKLTSQDFLALDEKGVLAYKKEMGSSVFLFSPPLCQLKLPIAAGQEWEWQGDFPGIGESKLFFIVEGQEEVSVPAGKFKAFKVVMKAFDKKTSDQYDAMRLMFTGSSNVKVEPIEPICVQTRWVSKDVGIVKETFKIKDVIITSELKSYSLATGQKAQSTSISSEKQQEADVKKYIEALSDFDPDVLQKAIANLAARGDVSVPNLLTALSSSDAQVRWGAAGALALIGSPAEQVLPSLKNIMSADQNKAVRQMAQLAAYKIGGNNVILPPATVRLTIDAKPGGMVMSSKPEHMLLYLAGKKQDASTLILSLGE